ncbi:MAG TPA: 50S ribosomal protein L5 [Actinobacteria bacterium]|nr:50S ribosomal protein L5 [Actinomycetota bacterium]
MAPRLKEKYEKEIIKRLLKELGKSNRYELPLLEKITVNMGVGEATQNAKVLDACMTDMSIITGQKPKITRAKKSVAGFKLRAGQAIGCMVTLRGDRMYEFLDRLLAIAIPRIRDFRGLKVSSFDGRGNYSLGISEQLIFPEIDYDKIEGVHGMDITVTTTAEDNEAGFALLKAFGFPFKEAQKAAG